MSVTITDEMVELAIKVFWGEDGKASSSPLLRAALAAVAPLIEAQARERALREAAERIAELERALRPFTDFIGRFDAKPTTQNDDEFYIIHSGTEYEASLRYSDMRQARAVLIGAPQEAK